SGGSDDRIGIWSTREHAIHRWIDTPEGRAVAVSQTEGIVAACSNSDAIRIWDVKSAELRRKIVEPKHAWRVLAASADGKRIVAAGARGEVFLWDASTGKLIWKD